MRRSLEEKAGSASGDGQEWVCVLWEGGVKHLEVSAPCPVLPCL